MVELSTLHIKAPHEVHIGAKARAAMHGKSMNQYVVDLIRTDLGEEGLETARVGIRLYRNMSPTEKKILVEASEIVDKMKVVPSKNKYPDAPIIPAGHVRPCKHGADPKFCKFSRPGKPCK